ncbi:hypothetical protein ALO79_200224 [Pseudomonas syringae pv. castaneae]|uniref:Cell division protein FtsB n=1 Tax=Pseudomonas syringae pv. castaneae TaxID=264450 RepID=A0A0P9N485_PSESX|nr:hypothetical protein ALO79_200224 [Pseudomonas syringae pv. castaneae]
MDHLRIGQVLALGGGRHHQVILYQPDDQSAVPSGQLVPLAKRLGIHRADFRVVALATLANVVVQPGHVDQFRLGQLAHEFAGQREFFRDLGVLQLAQMLDQVKGMGIDGIDMKQVVLHLPDDKAKLRQVAPQDPVAVHASQVAVHADLALEQLDEQAGVADVVAEVVIDQVTVLPQQANGIGAYSLDLRLLGHQYEDFEHGEGGATEHIGVTCFDVAVVQLEAGVDRLRRRGIFRCEDDFLEVLDDQFAELGDAHHHPVVLLHEVFDGLLGILAFETQQGRDGALVIEQQAVFGTPGEHVQGVADLPQKLLG